MNSSMWFFFISVVICVSMGYGQQTNDKVIQEYFKNLENTNYDKQTAPSVPVVVKVSSYILDIYKIDDVHMELSADFYFRQHWNDSRLKHNHDEDVISVRDESPIWTPDLFFIEERKGIIHTLVHPNKFIRITKTGEVIFSIKVTLRFGCPMDLRSFPHDIQKCTLNIESYGNKKSHIDLEWMSKVGVYDPPVSASENITMLDFDLIEVKTGSRTITASFGEYSNLQIFLTFQRKFGFFATRLYVPFIILVLMSVFSFCIKADERILRLSLLIVILYLMVTLSTDVNSLTPPTPYTKATDVWIGFCESLVFAAFIEFIIVALIAKRDNENFNVKGDILPTLDPEAKDILSTDSAKSPMAKLINMFDARNGGKGKKNSESNRIDRICRIVFPLIFLLFNVIYWSVYSV